MHDDGEDEASVDACDVADGENGGFHVGDFLVGVVGYAPLFAADFHVGSVVVEARRGQYWALGELPGWHVDDVTDSESKVCQSDVDGQPVSVDPSPQYDTYLSSGAIVGLAAGAELVDAMVV